MEWRGGELGKKKDEEADKETKGKKNEEQQKKLQGEGWNKTKVLKREVSSLEEPPV